jgi:hypothetical protein
MKHLDRRFRDVPAITGVLEVLKEEVQGQGCGAEAGDGTDPAAPETIEE